MRGFVKHEQGAEFIAEGVLSAYLGGRMLSNRYGDRLGQARIAQQHRDENERYNREEGKKKPWFSVMEELLRVFVLPATTMDKVRSIISVLYSNILGTFLPTPRGRRVETQATG